MMLNDREEKKIDCLQFFYLAVMRKFANTVVPIKEYEKMTNK